MIYHLDTSVCVSILRNNLTKAADLLPATATISSIVSSEIWIAAFKHSDPAARRNELHVLFAILPILDYPAIAAEHYGEIRAFLEKQGTPIGPLDLLIASHARSAGAALITGNVREFQRVPGLKVVPWK